MWSQWLAVSRVSVSCFMRARCCERTAKINLAIFESIDERWAACDHVCCETHGSSFLAKSGFLTF